MIARARLIERGMLAFKVAIDWGVRTLGRRPPLGMKESIVEGLPECWVTMTYPPWIQRH